MSHRKEQLESSLRKVIGGLLAQGLNDPRVKGLITVTSVRYDKDDHAARVGISVMPEKFAAVTLQGLSSAARFIQTQVGQRLRVRQVPRLTFHVDEAAKRELRVLEAIDRAMESGASRESGHPTDPSERSDQVLKDKLGVEDGGP